MRLRSLCAALLAVLCAFAGTVSADIAFPARLDVAETEPGIFAVTFTLPIIEGRKLRAEPRMPPTCSEIGPREIGASSTGYTAKWSVRCDPPSLAGEAILIEGLLGTQTDLAFSLTTLDGRTYSRILRPSRPGFLVPEPLPTSRLAGAATIEGARRTLRHPGLWLLIVVAALLSARPRELVAGCCAFAAGQLLAQWMAGQGWLEVSSQTRDLVTWAAAALPAIRLAEGGDSARSWLRPLWPAMLLIGLLFGGAQTEAIPSEGLSTFEQNLALVFFVVGAGVAVGLMAAAALELRTVTHMVGEGRWWSRTARGVGYVAGAVSVGLVVVHLAGLALRLTEPPRTSLAYVLLALILGPTLALAGRRSMATVVIFATLSGLGLIPGLLRVPLPFTTLWTLGSLIVLGLVLAVARPVAPRWLLLVATVAVPTHAWSVATVLVANVSRSTAVTIGSLLVGVCVFYGSLALSRDLRTENPGMPARILGCVVAAVAVAWRLLEYRDWFEREVATEAALGLLRLPLLALLLVGLAALLWPRRRRVAEELGVGRISHRRHLLAVGAALLLVPCGTVAVPNPFFEPHAPRGDEARRVASRVLSETYHAFNLKDEDRLYDTLAESVMGDLVDEVYLDSRRRLTAGTREGTQVTVREVGVLEIGEPFGGVTADEGFSYDCRWKVVARVQHLQHVHHRHNIYAGVLTLRSEDGRWKIAGVELHSEDRVVAPWQPS